MKIGIDISQLAYPNTGVSNYLSNLLEELLKRDGNNTYILFYSSLRRKLQDTNSKIQTSLKNPNVKIKLFKFPPTLLDLLWNKLHILPIEWLIGPIDIFISSDWTQPPTKARKLTIIYDLVVLKYPNETDKKIIEVQKRKLDWVKKEIDKIICISKSTKEDTKQLLKIPENKLEVVYPGI